MAKHQEQQQERSKPSLMLDVALIKGAAVTCIGVAALGVLAQSISPGSTSVKLHDSVFKELGVPGETMILVVEAVLNSPVLITAIGLAAFTLAHITQGVKSDELQKIEAFKSGINSSTNPELRLAENDKNLDRDKDAVA